MTTNASNANWISVQIPESDTFLAHLDRNSYRWGFVSKLQFTNLNRLHFRAKERCNEINWRVPEKNIFKESGLKTYAITSLMGVLEQIDCII